MNNKGTVNFMSFNTGRQYTKDGQKLYCSGQLVSDGSLEFWDIAVYDASRSLVFMPRGTLFTQESIMQAYDSGHYENTSFGSTKIREIIEHFHLGDH